MAVTKKPRQKTRKMAIEFLEQCPPVPEKRTVNGSSKYPFDLLDSPGKGLDVSFRDPSTVREALKHWKKVKGYGEEMVFTIRKIDVNKVRVRRDK